MSAQVIYGVDFRAKVRRGCVDRPETMEEWANRILTEAGAIPIAETIHYHDTGPCETIPYGGSGIDGMPPEAS